MRIDGHFSLTTPPDNIITSRIPGGVEVSTIRLASGKYETRSFLPEGGESISGFDFALPDALRTHATIIETLCGTDMDALRGTEVVKVEG